MSNWSKKINGVIFIPTGSSATGSIAGMGMFYGKSDGKLYSKSPSAVETEIGAVVSGTGTNPIIREYIANDTWNKPTGSNFYAVMVICIGAGGGGGSGRRGSTTTGKAGGSGGGGGAYVTRIIQANSLSSSVSITIGTGGIGGSYVTVDSTDGNPGSSGGDTSFGSWVVAKGGSGGGGGGASSSPVTNGGAASTCTPAFGPYSISGGVGGRSIVPSSFNAPQNGFASIHPLTGQLSAALPGGGAGGSGTSTDSSTVGRAGGGIFSLGTLITGPNGGDFAGNDNGVPGTGSAYTSSYYFYDTATPLTYGIGSGGGGGIGATSGTSTGPGQGGKGGRGSGGGGGGASTNGVTITRGNGGDGGDGVCIVLEIFG